MKELVWVRWIDSHMDTEGWKMIHELEEVHEDGLLVNSVGFAAAISDEAICLAPNYVEEPEQVSQLMIIPRSAVLDIRVLRLDDNATYSVSG